MTERGREAKRIERQLGGVMAERGWHGEGWQRGEYIRNGLSNS